MMNSGLSFNSEWSVAKRAVEAQKSSLEKNRLSPPKSEENRGESHDRTNI